MVKVDSAEHGFGSRGIFPPKPYVVSDLNIYPSKTTTMSEVETAISIRGFKTISSLWTAILTV